MTQTPTDPAQTQTGLAQRTSRGLIWMLLSSLVNKGGMFLAQIVLGWLLIDKDFGLYAIAISVSSLVQVFRDGGTRKIVTQRGERHFHRLCPSVFWMATAFNVGAALVLAGLAYPASKIYGEPQLVGMLLILSLSCLVGTPETMYRAWLSVQQRFRSLAKLQAVNGLIRSSSMVLLALFGAGAQSFVWPAVIATLGGWIMGRVLCGPMPISGRVRVRLWRILFNASLWLIIGSGAMIMTRQGPYMILGYYHDTAVVGIYFFAFQLLMQLNQFLSVNIQAVLMPTLSSVQRNTKRHSEAVMRSCQVMTVLSVGFAMGMSIGMGDLIRFIWGDKWIEAIPAVYWMGLFFPSRMLLNVFEPAMQSRGRYKDWALISVLQSIVIAVTTLLIAQYMETPGEFALGIGASLLVTLLLVWALGLPRIGVSVIGTCRMCLPVYLLGSLVYIALLFARFELGFEASHGRLALAMQGVVSGLAFVLIFTLLARVFFASALSSTLNAIPARFARPCLRALRLPTPS